AQLSKQKRASIKSEQPWSNQELAATSELIDDSKQLEHKQDQHKVEKKIAVLEDKISKETATRQQLELAVAQKDKIIRQLQHEQDKLQQQTNLLKEQIAMYELKIANLKWE